MRSTTSCAAQGARRCQAAGTGAPNCAAAMVLRHAGGRLQCGGRAGCMHVALLPPPLTASAGDSRKRKSTSVWPSFVITAGGARGRGRGRWGVWEGSKEGTQAGPGRWAQRLRLLLPVLGHPSRVRWKLAGSVP